ncbi:PREDICTED: uncharacterized protein LOC108774098 [Cyphomyrmex costatus]|uniref:uncharacterized protein LOC108774098 n=1 Tax=Cyphomyrmex costatus TaxID=456900 RepID=UPI00085235C2|nr:PREDICTED: uncharacterized protein LOC108774098 [Cyphomyrmex costatus]
MSYEAQKQRFNWILIFLLSLTLVSSHETVSSNYQDTPGASTLKIEAKESEASITLGKELVLGPPLSTKPSIVIDSNHIISTKIVPFVSPTIINQVSSGEHAVSQRTISKNTGPRSSYVDNHKSWVSKSPKTAWKRDSYLQALMHSRNSDDSREGIIQTDSKTKTNRREYVQGPIYKPETEYGSPDLTYASKSPRITFGELNALSSSDSYPQSFKSSMDYSNRYSVPQNSYGPPPNSYGPSNDGLPFHPQTTSYGLPGNYLPPQQGETRAYGAPYALSDVAHISLLPSIDLGLPFALKLNAFTVAKIILKLVIFKMIVKFIAVICLLLFIPKLEIIKKKVSNKDDDEERKFSAPYASMETLNNLEDIVKSSIEKYEMQNNARSNSTKKCTMSACRITEAFTFHESWPDYLNLFKSYVEEERQLITEQSGQ